MSLTMLLSFMVYSFVTSVTPGPNNIMLTASGLNFGFKRSIPHILGIGFGFGLMVTIVGLGVGSLLLSSEPVFETLKIIGIAYLLYLAWKIANAGATNSKESPSKPLSFWGAALFQWVNAKAWIMTMGAITAYTNSSSTALTFLIIGLIYGAISIPSVGVWAILGEQLQKAMKHKTAISAFNISMALLLVASITPSAVESFKYIFF